MLTFSTPPPRPPPAPSPASFTREHAAADLLDVMRRNPLPPWNMPAFAAYTQQQVAALQAAHQRGGAGLGTRAGAGVGVGAGGGAAAGRQVSFLEWLREHPEVRAGVGVGGGVG
mgnify:CR=1 FL=1